MAKRKSLDDFKATKPGAEAADVPVLETVAVEPVTDAPASKAALVGQTLRLTPDAWRQLKFLCVDQSIETRRRVTAHDLIREGLNLLFKSHGKPPIA